MEQTAVEWLFENLDISQGYGSAIKILEQAKEMEKQQIIDAYTNADNIQWDKQIRTRAAEQYYNQTFKSK
jgi:hypothetical protein